MLQAACPLKQQGQKRLFCNLERSKQTLIIHVAQGKTLPCATPFSTKVADYSCCPHRRNVPSAQTHGETLWQWYNRKQSVQNYARSKDGFEARLGSVLVLIQQGNMIA
jgi:hypothetical protein